MNKDICYGFILFFIVKSILGIVEIIGYTITSYLLHNIYITPILLLLVVITLIIVSFRLKNFPPIPLWVLPIIVLINIGTGYLDYPQKMMMDFSELDRAILFSTTKGIEQISLLILVILIYIRYYRLNKK